MTLLISSFSRRRSFISGLGGKKLLSSSLPRFAGAGPSPGWSIPDDSNYHKSTYQPTIPDKHFATSHYNYAPITLWLRSKRPTMEKLGLDLKDTLLQMHAASSGRFYDLWCDQLPGFGLKVLGFLGVLLGYNAFCYLVLDQADAYMNLEKLKLYETGKKMASEGFFMSESEDREQRMQEFNLKSLELEKLFEDTLQEATQKRDFNVFVKQLDAKAVHAPLPRKEPLSWRFNQMPYGRNSPDVVTFPDNGIDSPSSSLFFFGDIGSTGDYIERVDNKMGPLKKARHLYTASYQPPTK